MLLLLLFLALVFFQIFEQTKTCELLLLLLLSRRVTKLADDDDSRSFSLLLWYLCWVQRTEYECITFDDDEKRKERDRNRKRKMTTDRYFFFDSCIFWLDFLMCDERADFLRPCFCCSFFHHHRAYGIFGRREGETEKKNLRKNETKRHNCACDWLWYEEYTMFWGRKKKEEEKQQQPKKKKICCACPETKEPRDQCVGEFGAEDERCKKLVEAHLVCLRKEGFDVWFRVTHWWWWFC